jgi:hypothetical protein
MIIHCLELKLGHVSSLPNLIHPTIAIKHDNLLTKEEVKGWYIHTTTDPTAKPTLDGVHRGIRRTCYSTRTTIEHGTRNGEGCIPAETLIER